MDGYDYSPAELDPLGNNQGLTTPYIELNNNPPPSDGGEGDLFGLNDESPLTVTGRRASGAIDGMKVPWAMAVQAMESGAAVQCPNNYCGPALAISRLTGKTIQTSPFTAYGSGRSGYWVDEDDPHVKPLYPDEIAIGVRTRFVPPDSDSLFSNSFFIQQTGPSERDKKCADKLAGLFSDGGVASVGDYDAPNLLNPNGSFLSTAPVDPTTKKPIFGQRRNLYAPPDIGNSSHGATPRNELGSGTDRGGVIHIYPNESGHLNSGDKAGVYVPQGFTRVKGNFVGANNLQWFENKKLGVLISIAHVDNRGVKFGSAQNAQGSNLLGYFVTGGGLFGGTTTGYYEHTHISFWNPKTFNGDIRTSNHVDPRKSMCKEFGL